MRQRPPVYSAVKIGGERAYRRARRGEQFEMPERIVTVYRFEQLWRERGTRRLRARLPDRVLRRDLRALADRRPRRRLLRQLRRTAIGPFEVRDAVAPAAPRESRWRAGCRSISIERALVRTAERRPRSERGAAAAGDRRNRLSRP